MSILVTITAIRLNFEANGVTPAGKIVIDYEVKITSITRDTHLKNRGQSNVTSSPRSSKAAQCLKWL